MSTNVSHGYLPAGHYIINHDIMHCTAEGVAGNDLYSGRALGLSEADDYIQLHPLLKLLWNDIANHYQRIGLGHSENVIWDLSLKQVAAYDGYRPSVFYFGPAECKAWNDPEWSAVTLKTKHRTLSDLAIRDLEFDMKTGEGLVLVNWGTVLKGKLVLLLAGSPDYQQAFRNDWDAR